MTGRNPDLPILDELGAELEALASAAWAAEANGPGARRRAAAVPSREGRERRAQLRRIGRRATIVLVLLCLVGGAAFAALRGGGGSADRDHTAPTPLGRAADGAWTLSAYRHAGRLCTVFVPRGGELSGNCGAAPGRGRVRAASAIADGRRYLFGIAGSGVGRVSASLGEAGGGVVLTTAAGRARAPIDRGAASDAGFPGGDRWFVFDLGPVDSTGHPAPPAVVTPFTGRGDRAGPPYVDCSLGVIGPACVRRIEAAAAGH